MKDYGLPEVKSCPDAGHVCERGLTELSDQQCFDVLGANASRSQFVAIAPFGQVGFGSKTGGRFFDRFLERQVLERVQRVVMNEDADWTLRGEQVRDPIDDPSQRMVECYRVGFSEGTMRGVVLRNFDCPPGAILKPQRVCWQPREAQRLKPESRTSRCVRRLFPASSTAT